MRVLSVSRGNLELARVHLTRPFSTIGRSPSCDVVLRAEGLLPIHFLMEWVGPGVFNPAEGAWSIFDVSRSSDHSGEGVMLGTEGTHFGEFVFKFIEDKLQNAPEIGGQIQAALTEATSAPAAAAASALDLTVVEVVQIRPDSGAAEEVLHLEPRALRKVRRPLRKTKEFKLTVAGLKNKPMIRVLLEEMPGAVVLRRGMVLNADQSPEIGQNDLLEVKWRGHHFFLRFVDRVLVQKGRRKWVVDPLFFKLSLCGFGVGVVSLITALVILSRPDTTPDQPPPRVATIEVKQEVRQPETAKTETAPIPPDQAVQKFQEKEDHTSSTVVKSEVNIPERKSSAPIAAPKFQQVVKNEPKKTGLNSSAKVQDVNRIGILGALKGTGPKGAGAKVENIDEAVISRAVSGDTANPQVVMKAAPVGGIGNSSGGSRKGNSDLASASTTLNGDARISSHSVGPIAGTGGKLSYTQGAGGKSSLSGIGVGSGGAETGETESVEGGLDRETVRRIINQYRSQIRTCYEKALLSNATLNGRVVYKWLISSSGPVATVRVMKSTAGSPVLEGCVQDVIRSMRFPEAKNNRDTTVIYPFVFQARS